MGKLTKLVRLAGKLIIAGLSVSVVVSAAVAAEYPSKPITLVAPYPAGGSTDIAARILASISPNYLSQPFIVINKSGAGGVVGSTYVNKAKPDGYTLLLARVGAQSISPAMKANIPYKYNDFTMLGVIELNPVICATASSKPYKTMKELLDAVRMNPGKLSYSSSGIGTLLHIAVPLILDTVGIKDPKKAMIHVPYKGGGPAAVAAVGGHVDLVCTNSSALASHIAGGKLRALVITTSKRQPVAPNAPTARELGWPDLEVLVGWSGLFGPPGMDKTTVAILRAMLQKAKGDKSWNKFTKAMGSVPNILNGADTKAFVDAQFTVFNNLVTKLDLRIK